MKIKSILIANRGEIAVRIIKTAKRLKIKTYVIKTSKEPKALYLQYADEICDFTGYEDEIPEFLNIERIIETAKQNKIQAIHPGYGFLAENPYFAQRCREEKVIFIGPTSDAIYKMGNKTIAKEIARKHNIPLVEGSNGSVKTLEKAKKIAARIGYPIIIKAASGGGGRGMRIVNENKQLEKYFNLARNEAEKAFNDASVFIEKYVKNPKHIEFQVIADNHGNVVHLGERDCSVQRKHQKLIEQSPSTALDEVLREEMGKCSVKIAKAVNYNNAGTVEFLVDENKNFYFIEMNTRIQVEHPVTEEVTELDLIELQIKVAENKKLFLSQKDIKFHGWAIEYRINAEDVQSNFAPNTGLVDFIKFPKNKNIRIDTGIESGSLITSNYDSMIAKLIVKGKTRKEMLENSRIALENTVIKGLRTTIPFHLAVINSKKFVSGDLSTSFIEKDMDQLFIYNDVEEMLGALLAVKDYAIYIDENRGENVDYEKGKDLTPWLLNKRLK